MKHKMFFVIIATLLLAGCSPKVDADKFLIEGRVENIPDSVAMKLCVLNGGLLSTIAADTAIGGHFSFADTISAVKKLFLLVKADGFSTCTLPVWAAPGEYITIKGEDRLLSTWIVNSNLDEQRDENMLQACAMDVLRQCETLLAEETDAMKEIMKHRNDTVVSNRLRKKIDSSREKSFPLLMQVYKARIECMATMPRSRVWMETFVDYAKMAKLSPKWMPFAEELKALYESLPEESRQSEQGRLAYGFLYPKRGVAVGDSMADATLYDIEGREHHLSEFSGRYILLDFWSIGCGPCVESIPEVEEIAAAYADRLSVVSLSIDPKEVWIKYVREKGLAGHQWNELVKENTGLQARYNVSGIPHYVLIAPDGKVQTMCVGYGKGVLWKTIKEYIK
ncbi:MAG: AhpC/TSA family protein [Bacteroidaceae bacterium]|nr:AhpC/TSA family protein [Bacteroidaceae bacterium]